MRGEVVPASGLAASDLRRMLTLLDTYFEGVTHEQFERDLKDKTSVVLLRDEEGTIQGFSTFKVYRSTATKQSTAVVCSGDTIVDLAHRASTALARTWLQVARSMAAAMECERSVWLLIVSGFRTYRFMPVFWRRHLPRHGHASDADRVLLIALAFERFGPAFDASSGIVRLSSPQRLRPQFVEVPSEKEADPEIRFFLERNPGHAEGDELVCLCDLDDANLTAVGRRLVFGRRGNEVS